MSSDGKIEACRVTVHVFVTSFLSGDPLVTVTFNDEQVSLSSRSTWHATAVWPLCDLAVAMEMCLMLDSGYSMVMQVSPVNKVSPSHITFFPDMNIKKTSPGEKALAKPGNLFNFVMKLVRDLLNQTFWKF